MPRNMTPGEWCTLRLSLAWTIQRTYPLEIPSADLKFAAVEI
jgi:hypothetical protein